MKIGLMVDNAIYFTDGSKTTFSRPADLLASVMGAGKLTVYITDFSAFNPFVAHIVAHLPRNEHHASLSWDAIISTKGRFFSFEITIDRDNRTKFYELSNLLRDGYRADTGNSIPHILEILRIYEQADLCRITAGSASMKAYHEGDIRDYQRHFPHLTEEQDRTLRPAYLGGYMLAREGHWGQCIDIDCNSMYPSILRDEWLPFGEPEHYDGAYQQDDDMPLHVDKIIFRADLKPDGFAFLNDGRMRYGRDAARLTTTDGYITRTLTDIDQKLLMENYDVTVYKHVEGWKFRRSKGFFYGFVSQYGNMKMSNTGDRRQFAKLIMNALVGKMASMPRDGILLPKSDDGRMLDWIPAKKQASSLSTTYLPVPIWVNAYARRRLLHVCRANADRLVYSNTDGCALLGWDVPKGCEIDPVELGKWKISAKYKKMTILAINRYQGWRPDGTVDICMAGNLFSTPIPYSQYHHGVEVVDDYGTHVML